MSVAGAGASLSCRDGRDVPGRLLLGLRGLLVRRLVAVFVAAATAAAGVSTVTGSALAQPGGFADVAEDAYHAVPVATLAGRGVFVGTACEAGFCPDEPIDRKTMAVWMVRILNGEEPTRVSESRFDDVVAASFHAPFIERMADLEVTEGCGDGSRFCPDDNVSRAQMAAFISRAFNLPDGPDPGFTDVASDAWYAASVAKLAASKITAGCGDGTRFCPGQDTTRGQMAAFLARALGSVETPTTEGPRNGQRSRPTAFTAVSVGVSRACGLQADGTITCWGGYNPYGRHDPPQGYFSAVSVGSYASYHHCGVRTDGAITCWGDNSYGQTDAPQGSFSAISAGQVHSCGVRTDGTIACWSPNGLRFAPQGSFAAVSVGLLRSCGVRTDGKLICWKSAWTALEAPEGSFTAVTVGRDQSCGVHLEGTVTCWGHPWNAGHNTYAFTTFDPLILEIDGVDDAINLQVTYDDEAYEATVRWQAPSGTHGPVDHYVLQSRTILEDFGSPEFYQIVESETNKTSYQVTVSNATNSKYLYAFRVIVVYENGKRLAATEVKTPGNVHKLRYIIKEKVIEEKQHEQPWLSDVWVHINDSSRFGIGFGMPNITKNSEYPHPAGLKRTFVRSLEVGSAILYNQNNTKIKPLVHELGHVYTGTNGVSEDSAPIGIGYLYLGLLSANHAVEAKEPRRCSPHELYADLAVLAFFDLYSNFSPSKGLSYGAVDDVTMNYWHDCGFRLDQETSAEVTAEILAITKSVFVDQEIPQWFYDTYQKSDESIDLEKLWSDINVDNRNINYISIIAYHLRNEFGGYCSEEQVRKFIEGEVTGMTNPWKDGGCNDNVTEVVEEETLTPLEQRIEELGALGALYGSYPLRLLQLYNRPDKCWIAVDGYVYDVTPGDEGYNYPGPGEITDLCGQAFSADDLDPPPPRYLKGGLRPSVPVEIEWGNVNYPIDFLMRFRNGPDNCWIAINGYAYHATPGNGYEYPGPRSITDLCGSDASSHFSSNSIELPPQEHIVGSVRS